MGLAAFNGLPADDHTDKAEERGKAHPIARHCLPCDVRIGDPENGEHQHRDIGPVPE